MTPGRNALPGSILPASNAALLIDFDNVTLSVRSDLGKEMKTLLNSDLIRGKVSVKRAYADWRRYPQYVVSLTESSIDLIMAPAIGTSKKNATDLRMAVDAMELVFIRPEIGTFILLTGDSDFSSCVMKLKEYGKYVIGVGMREAASDLLIQSCDEYYSYHALSGLTKATEDEGPREDPWQLVRRAAERMAANGDSMRTDRLKQVMLDIDPGFDEGALGFSKFSRFVSEAQSKGILRLRKGDAGQYEIVVDGVGDPEVPRAEERDTSSRDRGRRNGRGRDRDRTGERAPKPSPSPEPTPEAEQQAAEPEVEQQPVAASGAVHTLDGSYALLQQVVRDAVGRERGGAVRDGETKRRMLDLVPDWDETGLGFSKFSRFLRQAHDEQVIDLRQLDEGGYEVALPTGGKRLPPPQLGIAPAQPQPPAEDAAPRGRRDRRGRSDRGERPADATPEDAPSEPKAEAIPAAEPQAAEAAAPVASLPAPTPAPRQGLRGRRGGPARASAAAPPPLLPGQVVTLAPQQPESQASPPEPETVAETAEAAAAPAEETAPPRRGRTRGRGRGRKATAPAAETHAEEPAAPARPELPADRAGIEAFLTKSFKGVGKKTVDALYGAFGDDVLRVMESDPDRVRSAVATRRVDTLLREFAEMRNVEAALDTPKTEAAATPEAEAGEASEPASRPRSRSRRGGRGRSRRKTEPTSTE